jgi:hypothetical protein
MRLKWSVLGVPTDSCSNDEPDLRTRSPPIAVTILVDLLNEKRPESPTNGKSLTVDTSSHRGNGLVTGPVWVNSTEAIFY